jgi:hypothetical protein
LHVRPADRRREILAHRREEIDDLGFLREEASCSTPPGMTAMSPATMLRVFVADAKIHAAP